MHFHSLLLSPVHTITTTTRVGRRTTATIMKFRKSTTAAAILTTTSSSLLFQNHQTEAWTTRTTGSPVKEQQWNSLLPRRQVSFFPSTSLQSTTEEASVAEVDSVAIAEEEEKSGTGSTVAEGTVVSCFNGGLSAVQITEGDVVENSPVQLLEGGLQTPAAATPTTKSSSSSSIGGDLIGQEVVFSDGSSGVVVLHRPPVAFVYSNGQKKSQKPEGIVKILDRMASIPIPDTDSVRVDWTGRASKEEEKEEISSNSDERRAIFAPIPKVSEIGLINNPMLSGITMFDALAPIGRGQNMLMIGHDLDNMRGYVCDFIASQLDQPNTKIVYAATSADDATKQLSDADLLDRVQVVAANDNENDDDDASLAAEAVSVAAAACAIGESFALKEGGHSLVIVDTIDQHKQLWDATTRVLVDIFGAEAVVNADRGGAASSEMRAFYSSLIQRAGQFNQQKGGGSVTLLLLTTIPKIRDEDGEEEESAVFSESDFKECSDKIRDRVQLLVKRGVPLSAENLRKIDIPIPSVSEGKRRMVLQHVDDLISMSDGQIWLNELLEEKGQCPPMDPQQSLTRIGIGADTVSQADAPALRKLTQGLRLEISQATNMMDGGADLLTTASQKQLRKSRAISLALHQTPGDVGRKLSESCTVLLAASEGYLDDTVDGGALAGTARGKEVVTDMLRHVQMLVPHATAAIDETLELTPSSEKDITDSINSFFLSQKQLEE